MIRFMMGLSLACLFVGCGDTATEEAPAAPAADETEEASTTPSTTEDVATADAPEGDSAVASTEEPAQETAPAELLTVTFKVPGMT